MTWTFIQGHRATRKLELAYGKWHEVAQTFVMADYVRMLTAEMSFKYCEYGLVSICFSFHFFYYMSESKHRSCALRISVKTGCVCFQTEPKTGTVYVYNSLDALTCSVQHNRESCTVRDDCPGHAYAWTCVLEGTCKTYPFINLSCHKPVIS